MERSGKDGGRKLHFYLESIGYQPGVHSNANNVVINYRDASAAACTASALFELSTYVKGKESDKYFNAARDIIQVLGSSKYRAELGKNGNFILMHSTGAIPQNSEIDVPLVYADYYFLEALYRYDKLLNGEALY